MRIERRDDLDSDQRHRKFASNRAGWLLDSRFYRHRNCGGRMIAAVAEEGDVTPLTRETNHPRGSNVEANPSDHRNSVLRRMW